jgi:very-short-patch-repair endonuclease
MDLISQVVLLGGVTDRRTLIRLRGVGAVARALRDGTLVRDRRGRYALPSAHHGLRTASSIAGVLSHRSAAHYWGWAQKAPDGLPEVTVPRNRRVDRLLRKILIPHWSDLPADDVVKDAVTSQTRTLVDCMRNLPLDEATSIVDSAVRAGDITNAELLELATSTRGRGRTRIIAVAERATAKSANVFESVLRAQADLVPGLHVVAQHSVKISNRLRLHPDLVDAENKIIIEAEGFEWHGKSAQLTRDCRRYNAFTLLGWQVIRVSWAMVMFNPTYVQSILRAAVALARSRRHQHANVSAAA